MPPVTRTPPLTERARTGPRAFSTVALPLIADSAVLPETSAALMLPLVLSTSAWAARATATAPLVVRTMTGPVSEIRTRPLVETAETAPTTPEASTSPLVDDALALPRSPEMTMLPPVELACSTLESAGTRTS